MYGDYDSSHSTGASTSYLCSGSLTSGTTTQAFSDSHITSDSTSDSDKGFYSLHPGSLYATGHRTQTHGDSRSDDSTDNVSTSSSPTPASNTTSNISHTANSSSSHDYVRTYTSYSMSDGQYSNGIHDGFSLQHSESGSEANHTWSSSGSNSGSMDYSETGTFGMTSAGMFVQGTFTKIGYGNSVGSSHDETITGAVTTTSDLYNTGSGDYYESGTRVNDVVVATMTFHQEAYQSDTTHEQGPSVNNYEQTTVWTTRDRAGTYSESMFEHTEEWGDETLTNGGHHIKNFKHLWCNVEDPTDCHWEQDYDIDEDAPSGIPGSEPPHADPAGAPGPGQGGGAAGRASGNAGTPQPRDCDGFLDCLVHPDWDLYKHYLLHGNDNPVDFLDHVINVTEYVAQGAAGAAILGLVGMIPVVGPMIVGGVGAMGAVGTVQYFANFGQMNANDHERFWGTLAGGLLVGGIVAGASRMGWLSGNCFVADTLVVMAPLDEQDAVVAGSDVLLASAGVEVSTDPNSDADAESSWSASWVCTLIGLGGSVLVYYSLRPRRRREEDVDELLASGDLIGSSLPEPTNSDESTQADDTLIQDEVLCVSAERK